MADARELTRTGLRWVLPGFLLGLLTGGYTFLALLVTDLVVIPVSGCQELSCLGWYFLPLSTVPVAAGVLVALLRPALPVLSYVFFLAGVVALVRAGVLVREAVLDDLLLPAVTGALATASSALLEALPAVLGLRPEGPSSCRRRGRAGLPPTGRPG